MSSFTTPLPPARMPPHWRVLPIAWLAVVLAGCQTAPPAPPTSAEAVGEFRPGSGYLKG